MLPTRILRGALIATLALTISLPPAVASAQPVRGTSQTVEVAAAARAKTFTKTPKPKVLGTAAVGAVVIVRTGDWKPKPKFTYRWRVGGVIVAGATGSRYTVRAADAGSRISVTVRAKKSGYRTIQRTSASVRVPSAAGPAPAPGPGDGQHRVNVDLAPGTYVTTGLTSGCYWERLSSFDGTFDSITANDFGSGQRIVTVLPGDYGVTFRRCGNWVLEADAPARAAIGDGIYLVGKQVQPGLYRAEPGSSGCYWATLSGFEGGFDSIIANEYSSSAGTAYVEITASARGFESNGCGAWTRE